jgi:hypothetical protein
MNQHEPNPRTPTRPITIALAAALVLTLAACGGGGGGGGGGTDTGTLDVTVTGLPAGTNANVAVSGPASFSQALTGSQTLSNVAVGNYGIAAQPVDAPAPIGATYDPVRPNQTAAVVKDAVTDAIVEYDLHECVMYEPTPTVPVDISGSWTASGSAGDVFRTITAPSDAGGGYVTVRLQANNAGIRPLLDVQVLPLVSGSIFTEATDPAVNPVPSLLEMVFEVAPGRQYQLTLRAASAPSGTIFPQGYTASWSFTSRVDCYEPNDTLATAKAIPLENPINASFIAGFRDSNSLPVTSEPTLDFYRFELHAPTAVRITLSDVVATVRPRLTLYNAAGSTVGSAALAPAAGQNAVLTSGTLAAGWYRVRVDTGNPPALAREAHTSRENETIPPHFLQNYTLVVETLD